MTTVEFSLTPPAAAAAAGDSIDDCVDLAAARDANLVGGKAFALGRMMRAGIAVPEGFVLTTRALIAESADSLGLADRTRDELTRRAAPPLALGPVAVRSSAVGEDGAAESFAGQLDSVLHVGDQAALERAVLAVWSSLWSERAAFYRSARGLPVRGMGIIVQRQVDARTAGVLFTVTSSGEMLVEYGPGLADRLVAGELDPARLALERVSPTSRELRRHAGCSLSRREIDQLRHVGLALEAEFGAPQDVEWAIDASGVLFVVQSRPITATVTIPAPERSPHTSARRIAWSNANVNENFPRPISPLLYSIAASGYTHYFRNLAVACGVSPDRIRAMEPAFQQIIGVHAARMYYNLTSIHSILRLAPFGGALTRSFDAFVGADGGAVDATPVARRGRLRQGAEVMAIAAKATSLLIGLDRRVARFERTVDAFASRTEPSRLDRATLAELREMLAGFIEIRCHRWLDASLADTSAMIGYGALVRLLRGAELDDASHTSLLKAIPDVVSGEPVLRLWELSRTIRRDPELVALFDSADTRVVLGAIDADDRFADFRTAFRQFLNEWGFRCSEELMLTTPSFQEDPAPLVDMLRAYARANAESPRDALRAQAESRERETRRVAAALGPVRAACLRRLLPLVHAAIRYRERARLKQALLYSRCRRLALAIGMELARRGAIAERDDVFFLTWQELLELTGGSAMFPDSLGPLIAMRTAEHTRLSAIVPPDAFTLPEGEYLDAGAEALGRDVAVSTRPSNEALSGTSACGGTVTGRATVLERVTQAALLERGDVLVTKQTDPGWGPAFFLISGLVIERGGMLSHGAIIAREFGIPCVVGVKHAMQRIPSGVTITVDGDRGVVHVVA